MLWSKKYTILGLNVAQINPHCVLGTLRFSVFVAVPLALFKTEETIFLLFTLLQAAYSLDILFVKKMKTEFIDYQHGMVTLIVKYANCV